MGLKNSKSYSNKSPPKVFKLVLNFPPNGPHKRFFFFFFFFFFLKFSNSPLYPMEKAKTHLSGKQATVERNGVEFGTRGEFATFACTFAWIVECYFGAIRCTCNISENTISKNTTSFTNIFSTFLTKLHLRFLKFCNFH